jgi:hypothetical protein
MSVFQDKAKRAPSRTLTCAVFCVDASHGFTGGFWGGFRSRVHRVVKLVGDHFQTMFRAEISKTLYESGEVQNISNLQHKLWSDSVVDAPRGCTLDPHEVDT